MKKHLILFIVAVSTAMFVGCDLETDHTPPNYVTFEDTSLAFDVHENESESYEVTVYTGNVTGSDRTFDINVEGASTLDPSTYTIPSSVTIPANTNEATFNVDVTGSGIDNAGDVLVLSLGQEEGLFTGNNLTFNIGKICDFEVTGNFVNTSVVLGGAANPTVYPVEIVAGAEANQYVAIDLYEEGKDVTFTVNPETNAITLPTQPGFTHPQYGAANVTGLAGSQVEPCLGQITLVIRISVAAGNFAGRTDVLEKGEWVDPDEGGEDGDGEDGDGEDGDGEDEGDEEDEDSEG